MAIEIDKALPGGPINLVDREKRWRCSVSPGDDVSFLPQNVQDAISKIWTPEVRASYATFKEEQRKFLIETGVLGEN